MTTNPLDKPNRRHRKFGGVVASMRVDVKRRRAMEMALNYLPIQEIADHFGVRKATIYDWLHSEHEKERHALSQMALQIRTRQDATYERILRKWLPLALSDKIDVVGTDRRGNPIQLQDWECAAKANEQVLRALSQQAKLHGLDAVKVDVQSGGLPISEALIKAVRDFAQPRTIEATEVSTTPLLDDEIDKAP